MYNHNNAAYAHPYYAPSYYAQYPHPPTNPPAPSQQTPGTPGHPPPFFYPYPPHASFPYPYAVPPHPPPTLPPAPRSPTPLPAPVKKIPPPVSKRAPKIDALSIPGSGVLVFDAPASSSTVVATSHPQPAFPFPRGGIELDFQVRAVSLSPPKPARSSLEHDLAEGTFTESWESWQEFEEWVEDREEETGVQFALVNERQPSQIGTQRLYLKCSRGGTGGAHVYERKDPKRKQHIGPKVIDCPVTLTVKIYASSSRVLGWLEHQHNHEIGNRNLPFTRISAQTREYIAGQARDGVPATVILEKIQEDAYNPFTSAKEHTTRDDCIELRDVHRIAKAVDRDKTRRDKDDGISTLLWVSFLQWHDAVLYFKSRSTPPPPGSNLEPDLFCLMIQTKWQQDMYRKYGQKLLCLDATHNVTVYANLLLTTLVVRDSWAHGIPVAYMLASKGTEDTIYYFLKMHHARNPDVAPEYIMTDFDVAQIKACRRMYATAIVLLCWWHVLRAWAKHLSKTKYPEEWKLLQRWLRMTDEKEFDATWVELKKTLPASFLEYFEKQWMDETTKKMWSAVYRTERDIWQDVDTNMLVEAWHHLLKTMFLLGKRNRRIDHIIYTLVFPVLRFFMRKQRRQEIGFAGDDLEISRRREIVERAQTFTKADIEPKGQDIYHVVSKSHSGSKYIVDMDASTCTCLDFPRIRLCKHLAAVDLLFFETDTLKDTLAVKISIPSSTDNAVPAYTPPSPKITAPTPAAPEPAPMSSPSKRTRPWLTPSRPTTPSRLRLWRTPSQTASPSPSRSTLPPLPSLWSPSLSPAPAAPSSAPTAPPIAANRKRVNKIRTQMLILAARIDADINTNDDVFTESELAAMERAVQDMTDRTSATSVLPDKLSVAPNVNSWNETTRVMPDVKTRHNGGGAKRKKGRGSSGSENDPASAPPPASTARKSAKTAPGGKKARSKAK